MKRIYAGNISEIAEKRSRVIRIGSLEIAIFKLSGGTIKAIENRCPHKAGKLSEGIVCDQHVFCPLHDWKINLQNGQVQAPDEGCVTSFQVEVDAASGEMYLHIAEANSLVS
ncbi:nitrite reductase small subunit NirD [Paenibacillus aceris]|uniref:Nitrite reductase (NADH) small subunit n=1 Tax=Paenibacillus aceris TaxID=869555 RepID=A0ABS4HX09_9BACL|nr:nitrite reductase small subunit NirD [Paenibacillus aceris]MBP1963168.1 nitrite reductase (NADH) small subunit [Paenibacillus aceris]NHW38715.1 nitrite reductase small subunit NirD [Paenibacillus aceris]